jgi:probable HAF family extracellular repeat protein
MNVKNSVIPRALLALALLAAAPAVFAQAASYNGSTIQQGTNPTVAQALAPNGTVVVGVPTGDFGNAFDSYKTGPNGAGGLTAIGPSISTGSSNGVAICTFCNPDFSVVAAQNNGIAANINNYSLSNQDEGYAGFKNSGVIITATGNKYLGNGTVVAGINAALSAVGTIDPNAGGRNGLGGYYPAFTFPGGPPPAYGYSFDGESPSVGPKNTGTFVNNPTPTVVVSNTMPTPFIELASANNTSAPIHSSAIGGTFQMGTPTAIATLGFGGFGTAINSFNRVVGTDYVSANTQSCSFGFCSGALPNTEAFVTGVNGTNPRFLGFANGVSSAATAINNAGQVGGYVTLADGTTEAFLTTVGGTLMVGLDSNSNSTIDFLNNSGQAIVQDDTGFYLYNAGFLYSMYDLFDPATLAGISILGVAGFNDAGQILLEVSNGGVDPGLLSSPTGEALPSNLGSDIRDSSGFASIAAAVGGTPGASFFTDPTGPYSGDVPIPSDGGDTSVPEPGLAGLLGFGLLAAGLARRKRGVVGV